MHCTLLAELCRFVSIDSISQIEHRTQNTEQRTESCASSVSIERQLSMLESRCRCRWLSGLKRSQHGAVIHLVTRSSTLTCLRQVFCNPIVKGVVRGFNSRGEWLTSSSNSTADLCTNRSMLREVSVRPCGVRPWCRFLTCCRWCSIWNWVCWRRS